MAVGVVLLSAVDPLAGYAAERTIDIKHLGEGQSIVRVDAQAKYLLLPVEESSPESKLYMIVDNDVVRTFNVRLAVNKVDNLDLHVIRMERLLYIIVRPAGYSENPLTLIGQGGQ
jgi:hypothetical protein